MKINDVIQNLDPKIFKSKNQFIIDAIQFYIDNYGKETFVIKKKEKERAEYIRSEDIEDIKEEVIEVATNEAIRQSRWMSRASQSIRMSAIRSQRISGKNSIMRLSRNMRKQRIRATKRRGRVPRNIMAIPIKRRTKRQHPFDNQ